jgi:hypothetical protein
MRGRWRDRPIAAGWGSGRRGRGGVVDRTGGRRRDRKRRFVASRALLMRPRGSHACFLQLIPEHGGGGALESERFRESPLPYFFVLQLQASSHGA